MKLLTLTFWKSVWIWCKVNWKFLVGFALPVLAGILLRKNKQNEILKKGLKFRKDQLLIEKEAAGIETSAKATAVENFISESSRIETTRVSSFEEIESARKDKIDALSSAEKVTAEINRRLKE